MKNIQVHQKQVNDFIAEAIRGYEDYLSYSVILNDNSDKTATAFLVTFINTTTDQEIISFVMRGTDEGYAETLVGEDFEAYTVGGFWCWLWMDMNVNPGQ